MSRAIVKVRRTRSTISASLVTASRTPRPPDDLIEVAVISFSTADEPLHRSASARPAIGRKPATQRPRNRARVRHATPHRRREERGHERDGGREPGQGENRGFPWLPQAPDETRSDADAAAAAPAP